MAALFDMQMAGGDCIWRLGNGMKRCDSQSWFASLIEWLMRRLFTQAANLFHRVCICISVFPSSLFLEYMYIQYVCFCAHTCVYLRVCIYMSRPQSSSLTFQLWLSAPWLLICSPSCVPHSPSLHPSHWGFHAPNREIHPHSQLCLQSEPSQS